MTLYMIPRKRGWPLKLWDRRALKSLIGSPVLRDFSFIVRPHFPKHYFITCDPYMTHINNCFISIRHRQIWDSYPGRNYLSALSTLMILNNSKPWFFKLFCLTDRWFFITHLSSIKNTHLYVINYCIFLI